MLLRRWIIPAAAAAVLLTPAGAALASVAPVSVSADSTQPGQRDSYVHFGVVRNATDTWDGRPVYRLAPSAERSGNGVYFMTSDSSGTVLWRSLTPFGQDSSDWRKVSFAMPRFEEAVSIRFGDPDDPSAAQTVAGVRVCPS